MTLESNFGIKDFDDQGRLVRWQSRIIKKLQYNVRWENDEPFCHWSTWGDKPFRPVEEIIFPLNIKDYPQPEDL